MYENFSKWFLLFYLKDIFFKIHWFYSLVRRFDWSVMNFVSDEFFMSGVNFSGI